MLDTQIGLQRQPAAMVQEAINDYEAERAARIARNQQRLRELGIRETVQEMAQAAHASRPVPKPRKRKEPPTEVQETRRSGRLQGTPARTMDEDEMFREIGISSLDLLPTRRRRTPMDAARLAELREARLAAVGGKAGRSAFDSGLGVRLQGGRVYDSTLGVTCHWCRQKTLEEHVECTAEGCGRGRLPVSFCRMCLRNRHGEDVEQAIASECWVCPVCRGSCGDGCSGCCNCGPCRKKAGLGPTHQIIKLARMSGFDNVHDYLVYTATKESPEEIAARKDEFEWGAFLMADDVPAQVVMVEGMVGEEQQDEEIVVAEQQQQQQQQEEEKEEEKEEMNLFSRAEQRRIARGRVSRIKREASKVDQPEKGEQGARKTRKAAGLVAVDA